VVKVITPPQAPTSSPDVYQAKIDAQQLAASELINPRAARRCWTPQEAKQFNDWDR